MTADPWYLRDSLARVRSGVRIRFDGKTYTIYNQWGDLGLCEEPSHALAYYMLCCSTEQQPPARVWPRDMLPWNDGAVTAHGYDRLVEDGVETADANFEKPA